MLAAEPMQVNARQRRLPAWAAACLALLLSVCGEPPSGPGAGANHAVRLAFHPTFDVATHAAYQQVASGIDNVHIVLRNALGDVVLDTIVAFPPGQDTVAIAATVQVHGESERFAVKFELRSGATTMFAGTQDVTARPGTNSPATASVPLVFVGPGARAAKVTVTPATSTLLAGAAVTMNAVVADSSGAPITGATLVWKSSNESSATVSPSGVVTALNTRGTATITASTLSNVSGSATVRVTLPPSKLAVASGDAQSGTVGSTLTQPFAVQVLATDGVGVGGVAVSFSTSVSGASVTPATATTDSLGRASASMTLGKLVGSHAFSASVSGLNSVSVSATAVRGEASVIAAVSGDAQVDTAGRKLAQPFVVKVTDANGNVASGVGITWSRVSGSGSLSAATTTTDAQGQTQVSYTLGNTVGSDVVRAAITAVPASSVTFTVTTRQRPPSRIMGVGGEGQSGQVGTAAAQALVVRVMDDAGQSMPGINVTWNTVSSAVLSTATTVTDSTGIARITFTYPTKPGDFTIAAQAAGLSGTSVAFSLTATVGPPASVSIVSGNNQTAPAGSALSVAPAVQVTDKFGNALAAVSVTFTAANGGTVSGSPATTNAQGVATLGGWTLGPTAGSQSLTASAGGVKAVFTATATAPVGPPIVSVVLQPSVTVQNTKPFTVQPKVQLKTAGGVSLLKTAGVVITVGLKTTGPSLRGVLTATTDTTGSATFTGLSLLGAKGTNVLTFSAAGYASDTSATFTITPGPAVTMSASTVVSFSGVVATAASPNPAVMVADSSGNGVGGVSVTFAVADTADGVVVGGAAVTDTTGHASPTSWTLGKTVRTDTLTATAAVAVGSPLRFIATVTSGAATQLVKISGDAQTGVTGNPLASPMIVEARDAQNNPVPGVSIGFAAIAGGGTPSTQTVTTGSNGQASFTLTLGVPGSDTVKACLPSCATAQVLFSALSIPVGADATWIGATSTSWTVTTNWSPAVVPGSTNKVFIPAGMPNSPALTADITLTDLTMASGATLAAGAQAVTISGNVYNTGATMTGTGYLYFCGGSHAISGGLLGVLVDCGATVTPSGTVTSNGGLTVQGGAVFDVASGVMTVAGNLNFPSGSSSRLKMITAGGKLSIGGDAFFAALDMGDGWLTDGTLEVKGNFTSQNYGSAFRASGNHVTRFTGTAAQSVYFQYTGGSYSQFANVEVTNTVGVAITSDITVVGTTLVGTSAVLSGAYTWSLAGQFTSQTGSNLSGLGAINVYAGGSTFPLLAGSGPTNVNLVNGAVVNAPSSTVSLPTNLVLYGGAQLVIGSGSLTINGNLTYPGGQASRLLMQTAGGKLTVTGDAFFGALDMGDGWLTDGTLEVKGNFTSQNYGSAFRASGNHVTRFTGTAAQSVYFQYTGGSYSQFANVEVTNLAGVTITSDITVVGTTLVAANAVLSGAYTWSLAGLFTSQTGSNLSGLGAINVYAGGNTFPLLAASGPTNVNLVNGAVVNAPSGTALLPTNLVLYGGARLVIGSGSLTINGNLTYPGGQASRLVMQTAGGKLTVTGNAFFGALDMGDGWLTDGTLEVKGNFTAQNYGSAFRASGNHITRFTGTAAQAVYFQFTGGSYSQFANVEIVNTVGVGITSDLTVVGNTLLATNAVLSGAYTWSIAGLFTSQTGSSLSGLGAINVYAGGNTFPLLAGSGPTNVNLVNGAVVNAPSGTASLPTNMALYGGAQLVIGTGSLTINGNLTYPGGQASRLVMQTSGGKLTVTGDAFFGALDMGDGWLTDGTLEVKGNFTAQNYGSAFRASGNHVTRFTGTAAQSVYFQYTGGSYSQFANVEVANTAGVTITSDITVVGTTVLGANAVMSGAYTWSLGGLFTAQTGSSLSGLGAINVYGGGNTFPLLAGSGPANVNLVGGAVVNAPSGAASLPTNLVLYGGAQLVVGANDLTVNGNLTYPGGQSSRLVMQTSGGKLTVTGDAFFGALDMGDGWLTDGTLTVKGNFTAQNYGSAFRATGNHLTRFAGTASQSVYFQYTGGTYSQFANVEITNASGAGVSPTSTLTIAGGFNQLGRFSILSQTVNVGGAVTLGPSSITTVSGGFNKASCSAAAGATFSGFSCP